MYPRSLNPPSDSSFFLFGPRGVGKTAWVRATFPEAPYVDLLDPETWTRLHAAPHRLMEVVPRGWTGPVVIDEVQRAPELLNEVHRQIEGRGLRFVLTGSSARKLRSGGVNLLAGRARTLHLHPLTAQELGGEFGPEKALRYGCLPTVWTCADPRDYLAS